MSCGFALFWSNTVSILAKLIAVCVCLLIGCVMSVCVKRAAAQFFRDINGGITALTVVVFLLMVLSVGMAVDFMRQETSRAELQNAVDRGILAAAAMTQTLDREQTVRAYMKSTNFIPDGYNLTVVPSTTSQGFTKLTANASYNLPTSFLKLAGITSLPVVAKGEAVEGISDIEVSLVLDVSTSMSYYTTGDGTESRLAVMKQAAKDFVDNMLNTSTSGTLTMSLVPFAGQVNPGAVAFNHLSNGTVHNYSHCIDFTDTDYETLAMPTMNSRNQTQYFNYSSPWNRHNGVTFPEVGWGWCPAANEEEIVYHSDNPTTLKTAIENLNSHEATGTQNGMKWGAMLLDSSSNALTSKLVTAGKVDAAHSALPAPHGTVTTKKFLVVMTDGNTTQQMRLNNSQYDSASERESWAENSPTNHGSQFHTSVERSEARARFLETCQAAKDAGIIVFTIGFDIEVGSNAHTDMSACATSASHFHDVDGLALTDAFNAIVQTIQKLKLVG